MRVYPWGDDTPDAGLANFRFETGSTVIVGSYPAGASPYGALDMAGNVEEWVADRYAGDYYQGSPESNPKGPEAGELRVLRGGSFNSYADDIRTVARAAALPASEFHGAGFRIARSQIAN
jgi:formylglycine-generating enzyme required for sulfatase activity